MTLENGIPGEVQETKTLKTILKTVQTGFLGKKKIFAALLTDGMSHYKIDGFPTRVMEDM